MCVRGDPANLDILREVLTADHRIKGLSDTLVITPDDNLIKDIFPTANFMLDAELQERYPSLFRLVELMPQWRWYYQQCLKLCAMDLLEDQRYLIHDSDCYFNVDYDPFLDDKLNFVSKQGRSWHVGSAWMRGQQDVYGYILGRKPVVEQHCVTEVCPYTKEIWNSLKSRLEFLHRKHWLDVIIDAIDPNWPLYHGLYEYYILINHAVNEGYDHNITPMTWINAEHGKAMDLKKHDRVTYVNTIYEVI
jgi:hypothetical protein